jgi:DNA-binding Lrp family transcriptional regulator
MEKLWDYQAFSSLEELNEYVHKVLKSFDINETTRKVFFELSKFSVKVLGVCWLKVSTIADRVGVSYKTVQRCLKSLVDLGIIRRVAQMRVKNGGQGASLTIMCPSVLTCREESVKPYDTYNLEPIEQSETITSKTTTSLKDNVLEDDTTFIEGTVDSWFIRMSSPFLKNKLIKKLWKKVQQCFEWYCSIPYIIDEETVTRAFKVSVYAYKVRRVKDFVGYFFSTLRNMIGDIETELAAQERRESKSTLFYDWLNE